MGFKIGDNIRVVRDKDLWLTGHSDNLVFEIVESDDHSHSYIDLDKLTIEYDVDESPRFSLNMDTNDKGKYIVTGLGMGISPESYKLSNLVVSDNSGDKELGVFRPDLETRKVGKVRVELVDDGFPLALREIAKVMTWAQDAKGYKDHDWQNLPNAEVALAAAASRHRTDHIKQRVVDGLTIEQCVDGESALLHKAHEAFGVLAQLELMLRGDIK